MSCVRIGSLSSLMDRMVGGTQDRRICCIYVCAYSQCFVPISISEFPCDSSCCSIWQVGFFPSAFRNPFYIFGV